ncbi:hypothetical protein BAU15_07390 [Enterococcus sp. JM4C]|uniref:helix-turn-helix domain-containing protein n=1 Tax=Candidatus Enterococcus huntleyi TaxID=1857217 RepID=UPI00137A2083|nr:helix-turn-helix domain-containing protein [Enterococcus sp. JM4C]KAF1297530.1 hypothetical protein BAU15_07390 [Enterococcus sp. JM4C]
MNPNHLLLEDQYYKTTVLQYIELNKNQYCTINKLSDVLSLSKYKTAKFIQMLHEELNLLSSNIKIEILSSGEILSKNISHKTTKELRVSYLKSSTLFQLFHNFLVKETPLERQIEDLHMSRSSAYNQHRELKDILKADNLILKKSQILGDEFQLRIRLYSLYYEAFNGIYSPFPDFIQIKAEQLINQLMTLTKCTLSETKKIKLTSFLNVWLTRLRTKHYITESFVTLEESSFKEYLTEELIHSWGVPRDQVTNEIAYLFSFIYLENIDKKLVESFLRNDTEVAVEQTAHQFFDYLSNECLLDEQDKRDLFNEVKDINRKWLIYHFRESTFTIKTEFHYFQEVNPKLDSLVKNFLNQLNHKNLFISEAEMSKLYYDYLFLLVTKIPISKIEHPLYICIDFSHGDNYNQYIRLMLSSLQSMNIKYEKEITRQTDIYISDCLIHQRGYKQLIWKKPPTPDDWRDLGELLVELKGAKGERI